jgi:hypothetical protein
MWRSWFVGHELVWLAAPAMFIFVSAFVVATVRALRTPLDELAASAAMPLADDTGAASSSHPS